jgi:ABC-type sugar transport system ATPase subunit
VEVGVRPHDVTVAAGEGELTMRVEVVEAMGFEAYAHGRVGAQGFVARLEGGVALPKVGETLGLSVTAGAAHAFDPETGASLAKG